MPVLPEEGSIRIWPGRPGTRIPSFSACSTIDSATRSLTEPPGLRPSSLTRMRTAGLGLSWLTSTIGVSPIRSRTLPYEVMAPATQPPATAGRMDDLVAVGDRCVERREVADVVVVHVDVDEAVQGAVVVQHLPGHARVLADQGPGAPRRWSPPLDHHGGVPPGLGAEDGRQADVDGHGTSRSQAVVAGADTHGPRNVDCSGWDSTGCPAPGALRESPPPPQLAWAAWVSTTTDSSVIVPSTMA